MKAEITNLETVDLCVVGSGAGGGVLAKEAAEAGLSVVVLEAGVRSLPERIPTTKPDWELRRSEYLPLNPKRDTITFDELGDPFEVYRHKGVGGSTMHYEGFVQRIHPADMRRSSEYGIGSDWPVSYDQLVPLYDRVEEILKISGELDNPFEPPRRPYPNPGIPFSCAVKTLKAGCDQLGLHTCHAPLAILSKPFEKRSGCNFCGGCWYGCHHRAISNIAETYVPLAERFGAQILEGCMAARIILAKDLSRAEGVEFFDQKRNLHLQRARAIAICGNAVESPRLLLNSGPRGIANSSGLVGKNLMSHLAVTLAGRFEQRVNGYMGPNVNGMVQDFYDSDDKRGFIGGYLIALKNSQLGPYSFYEAWAKERNIFGAELQKYMAENFGHTAAVGASGEMSPSEKNQVSLDPDVKDPFGLPVPRILIKLSDNDRLMLKHMEGKTREILVAAGAREITPSFSAGLLGTQVVGTCRMGSSPQNSVTNPFGQTHDIGNLFLADGSIFPSATPANASLTIQALATRTAMHIVERFKRGEI